MMAFTDTYSNSFTLYPSAPSGNFVCVDTGTVMGRHEGVQLYTVGGRSVA